MIQLKNYDSYFIEWETEPQRNLLVTAELVTENNFNCGFADSKTHALVITPTALN